jgi:hypothetical protein
MAANCGALIDSTPSDSLGGDVQRTVAVDAGGTTALRGRKLAPGKSVLEALNKTATTEIESSK